MRRFLLNGGFLAALFPVFGLLKTTIAGKRDWRLILAWVSWAFSLAVVIATILNPTEEELAEDRRDSLR
ncbi:MAG: hypothetical protein RL431_957 [Actinomycetota bacterium]|jgi:hypothetical protein